MLQSCRLTFSLPPTEKLSLHLYTTDIPTPPAMPGIHLEVTALEQQNSSLAGDYRGRDGGWGRSVVIFILSGLTITTVRSISYHLMYQYLPAGQTTLQNQNRTILNTLGLLCLMSLLGLVLPLHMSTIRIGLLTIILLLLSSLIR